MASSQKIDGVTACLTKDQNLLLNCTYTTTQASLPLSCVFTFDKKIVTTTNSTIVVDPTYKSRATASIINNNVCQMTLKGYSDDQPQTYNCNLYQGNTNATAAKTVEKSKNYIHFYVLFPSAQCCLLLLKSKISVLPIHVFPSSLHYLSLFFCLSCSVWSVSLSLHNCIAH